MWCLLTDGAATACVHHRTDILDGLVFNFKANCEAVGCRKEPMWGSVGKQPTHCRDNGHLEEALVRPVGIGRSKGGFLRPYSPAVQGPSHLNVCCEFVFLPTVNRLLFLTPLRVRLYFHYE